MTQILAKDTTAAKMLDMRPSEFRRLVEGGFLPRGREVAPGMVRWPVEDLRRIVNGDAVGPDEFET